MDNQNNGGVNTILIVVILLILVGGAVWYFTKSAAEPETGFEVDVNLPTGNNDASPE